MSPPGEFRCRCPLFATALAVGALCTIPRIAYADDRAQRDSRGDRDADGDGSYVEVPPSRVETFFKDFEETLAAYGTIGLRSRFTGDMEPDREFSSAWAFAFQGERLAVGTLPGIVQGANVELGTTSTGGFAYRYGIALGAGALLGGRVYTGATLGGGFSGITGGRVGFGLEAPVEAFAVARLGKRVHVAARGRAQWVFGNSARQGRGPAGLDEYETSAALEVPLWHDAAVSVSALAGHMLGGRYVGGTVGLSGYLWPGLEERWQRTPDPPPDCPRDRQRRPAARAGASP